MSSINDFARREDPFHGLDEEQRAALEAHIRARESTLKSEISTLKRETRALEKEIARRETIIAAQSYFTEIPRSAPEVTSGSETKHPSGTATAVFLASDWHIEESVDPGVVGGLNSYNIDVAWERSRQYFASVRWLLKAKRHEAKIESIVVALLGDFITGLVPSSDPSILREAGPVRAAAIAQEMLHEGLRSLRKHAGRIVVPCVGGNHGRLTPKPVFSRSAQYNLENYMLGQLAKEFAGDSQFEFVATDDFCIPLDIEGLRVRFSHGDNVRYAGGVGGITIPLKKARARWNATPGGYADLDCLGHFHQAFDGGDFVVNGSLIGMSGYARKGGFEYQPPEQIGFLVRPESGNVARGSRGKVDTFKVFVA